MSLETSNLSWVTDPSIPSQVSLTVWLVDPDVEEQLVQSAWIILNDSLRTTLCIRYPPKAVAAASLYYAAKNAQTDLYSNTQASEFELFPEAPKNQVLEVMEEFDSLYKARQKQKTEE